MTVSHRPDPDRLRVMTFNIRHGVGSDGRLDLARTAAVIAAADPDVAALQEVDRGYGPRSGFVDQAAALADMLGMAMSYGPCVHRHHPGHAVGQYGLATLSRLPVTEHAHTMLPCRGGEPRGALMTRVSLASATVTILNTHLRHDESAERLTQITALRGLVTVDTPVVLAGDFNAEPHSAEMSVVRAFARDAWTEAGAGSGETCGRRRIDYVFVSGPFTVEHASVLDADASDHRPLAVTLLLRADHRVTADGA